MSKVALLAFSYPRFDEDESSVFIRRLVSGYSQAGASGIVVVPFDNVEEQTETHENFQVKRYKYGLFTPGRLAFGSGIMPNIRRRPLLAFQVPLFLISMFYTAFKFRKGWEVIHANWAVSGLVALLLKITTGKPYILTLRGEDMNLLSKPLFKLMLSPALRGAKCITSVNESFLDTLIEKFPYTQEKILCIPNGVEVPTVTSEVAQVVLEKYSLDLKKRALIFVGTLIPRKNIETLIEAVSNLADYQLILAGRVTSEAYVQSLKTLAKELGCGSNVHFLGPVNPQQIPSLLQLSYAYVSASSFEGRPNSVLEAMAAGVPAVVSNIPAHQEIIFHQKTGLLFEANSSKSLISSIRYLEDNDTHEIVQGAKEATSGCSWKSCAEKYLQSINKN